MRNVLFILLLLLLINPASYAAEQWQPSLWLGLVRLIGALVLIVPLIYLVVRYWSRSQQGGGGKIKVLERAFLAQGKTLALVKVGEEIFLLAAAERGVTLLRTYRGEEAKALAETEVQTGAPEFDRILEGQLTKLKTLRSAWQKKKGPRQ